MRKVTAHLFSTADGVVDSPHLFQFDSFDTGTGEAMDAALANADAMVMGRVLYDQWSGYWPTADDEFGLFINPAAKYVASRTLSGPLAWNNSRLIEGDLVDFVRDLKETEGGDITLGGISVIRQLFAAGLVDALTFTVHPVLVGTGRKLFDDADITRMELIDSRITEKGNAILTYGKRPDEASRP